MATKTKNTSTSKDGNDEKADASPKELSKAANAGAASKAAPKKAAKAHLKEAPDPKTADHVKAEDFRGEVENTPAGDLDMDPREPYPTGNPPDPREAFHRMHGYYPKEE